MNLIILRSAIEDLDRGYKFYEKQEQGLGDYFEDSIYSEIESLRLYAGIHRKVHGYHRLLSKRFPYAVYYEKDENEVRIRAVLDCRRNPNCIRERIR